MGAVALVALIAGGPLGMCLALAYGVVTLTKIAKVDAQYAKNGQPPASAQLIQRWLDRRAAKGAKPEKVKPYGSWAYAKQRWLAMWQDLGEKHAEARNAYKAAVADAKATGRPLPPKPKQGDYLKGWQWSIDAPAEPGAGQAPSGQRAQTSVVHEGHRFTAQISRSPTGDRWSWVCRNCPGRGFDYSTQEAAEQAARTHDCPPVNANSSGPGPTAERKLQPRNQPADGPVCPGCGKPYTPRRQALMDLRCPECQDKNVGGPSMFAFTCNYCHRQFGDYRTRAESLLGKQSHEEQCPHPSPAAARDFLAAERDEYVPDPGSPDNCPAPQPTEGDTMIAPAPTRASGEVTGIRSAVHYLTEMAKAHAQHADNEALVASLDRMKVGAGDIAKVQAAMDASAQAAELYATAGDMLARNNAAVAEAYGSHGDAADKQAQMAE